MTSIWPFLQEYPQYADHALLERLVEPDRVLRFRVSWVDDDGNIRVNRAFRVQHSMAIGPTGRDALPSVVNLSILSSSHSSRRSRTHSPRCRWAARGGSFDPKGKSDAR